MSLSSAAQFFWESHEVKTEFVTDHWEVTSGRELAEKIQTQGHETAMGLCSGLSAIGRLIATIDHADKGYEVEALDKVGWLIVDLADLAFAIQDRTNHLTEALDNTAKPEVKA